MAGACGQSVISRRARWKRRKKSQRWGVKQRGGERSIVKRILAHLDQHHWVLLMSHNVKLDWRGLSFWKCQSFPNRWENVLITQVAILLVPNLFPITQNVNKALMSCWLHHSNFKELCQGNIRSCSLCHCSFLSNNLHRSNISSLNHFHSTLEMFAVLKFGYTSMVCT